MTGHYTAEDHDQNTGRYISKDTLAIQITVDETFDDDHRIVNQKGQAKGRFTFTSAESGEHRLCFWASSSQGGWFGSGHPDGVRLHLDMAIGATSEIESKDREKLGDLVQRVRDLNGRLADIRREQVFQRVSSSTNAELTGLMFLKERESEFRDQSESTNARVVRWSIIQLIVLGITCAWQLSHLRAFFIKQKLT